MNLYRVTLFTFVVILGPVVALFGSSDTMKVVADAESSEPKPVADTIWTTCQEEVIENANLTRASEYCMANTETKDESRSGRKQRDAKRKSERKSKQKQGPAKNWCFRACQLKQLGWIYNAVDVDPDLDRDDPSQIFNRTRALASVREIFPEDIRTRLQYGILKCGKSDAAEGLAMNKPRCNSYAKLVRCIDKVVRMNCRRSKRTTTTTMAPYPTNVTTAATTESDMNGDDTTADAESESTEETTVTDTDAVTTGSPGPDAETDDSTNGDNDNGRDGDGEDNADDEGTTTTGKPESESGSDSN